MVGHAGPLLAVVALFNVPYYALYAVAVLSGQLTKEASDALFGLVGLMLLPLSNGMVVYLADRWYGGHATTLGEAFGAARGAWSRLLTAYVAMGFVLLGWLVVTCGPVVIAAFAWARLVGVPPATWLLAGAALAGLYAVWAFGRGITNFCFLEPLAVLEGKEAWETRQGSAALARGRRLPLFGFWLLTLGPPMAIEFLDMAGDYLKEAYGIDPLATSLATGLVSACLYVVPVVFFYVYYRELSPVTKEP